MLLAALTALAAAETLAIEPAPGALPRHERTSPLLLRIDGEAVGALDGHRSVEVTPGAHHVTVERFGRRTFAVDVVVTEGEAARVVVPELRRKVPVGAVVGVTTGVVVVTTLFVGGSLVALAAFAAGF